MSLNIKRNDIVMVIAGKDKGKTGKVLKVIPDENRVVVEHINIVKKHKKAKSQTQPGGIMNIEAPLNRSNVMLYCSRCQKGVRFGTKMSKENKKVRFCKKCGEVFA